ncbi:MAG TPA: hypothetical protein VIX73_02460 [Kofleriaceae bacterium]|jgi:hypothetical protein
MKSIALLTALAAAIPAVAYADPIQTYERDRDYDRDRYRDQDRDRPEWFHHEHYDRFANSHWQTDRGRWVRLVRANSASGRREFMVDRQNRYRTFRLESLWGEPMIGKIAINFADGTTQVVQINGTLPAGAGEVIDLQGNQRRVGRIVVYADPRSRGGYAIFGS